MISSNGFLIVNKSEGLTSFDVVAKVRRALRLAELAVRGRKVEVKVGHLGTLDPVATGVLVLAVGEATKLIEYWMGADKIYEAEFELGKVSDTYDREGKIEVKDEAAARRVTREEVEQALHGFVGELACRRFFRGEGEGEWAYALARRGEKVEMKSRKVKFIRSTFKDFMRRPREAGSADEGRGPTLCSKSTVPARTSVLWLTIWETSCGALEDLVRTRWGLTFASSHSTS